MQAAVLKLATRSADREAGCQAAQHISNVNNLQASRNLRIGPRSCVMRLLEPFIPAGVTLGTVSLGELVRDSLVEVYGVNMCQQKVAISQTPVCSTTASAPATTDGGAAVHEQSIPCGETRSSPESSPVAFSKEQYVWGIL